MCFKTLLFLVCVVFPVYLLTSVCLQWISVPFALTNAAVSDITVTAVKRVYQSPWRGSIKKEDTWMWVDNFCLLVLSLHVYSSHNIRPQNSRIQAKTDFITNFF